VDARGHRCPAPTLRLRRALERARNGERIVLLATDPLARIDVPHFLAQTDAVLAETRDQDGVLAFTVVKRD
jgi:tRNA 2-thiouridine synthesizing protein A